jgi:hypothetical protein
MLAKYPRRKSSSLKREFSSTSTGPILNRNLWRKTVFTSENHCGSLNHFPESEKYWKTKGDDSITRYSSIHTCTLRSRIWGVFFFSLTTVRSPWSIGDERVEHVQALPGPLPCCHVSTADHHHVCERAAHLHIPRHFPLTTPHHFGRREKIGDPGPLKGREHCICFRVPDACVVLS